MKSRTLLGLALSLGVLASCSGDDQRFESTLTMGEARERVISARTPTSQAYGLRQLNRLADSGDARAQKFLANSYLRGRNGLPEDPVLAVRYFEMLRAGGNEAATATLTRLYGDTDGVNYDPDRLIAIRTEAYQTGDETIGLELAKLVEEQGDFERAQEIRSELMSQGSDDAQLAFAMALMDEDSSSYDPDRAIALFEELAARDNPRALREMGRVYMRGVAAERDWARAATYFERGLAAGDNSSGILYAILQTIPSSPTYDAQSGHDLLVDLALQGIGGAWLQLAERAPERYVMAMQQVLRDANFYQGPPTGEVDALTVQALVQYCPENNVAGDCTLDPLGRDLARALARTARNS